MKNEKGRHQQFIETNGVRLRTVVEGQGPLVILLHGFPRCWYLWRDQIDPLKAAGYCVAVPDQRGYGESSLPERTDAYSMLELAADVVGIADAIGEEKFHLVGHDFGCVVTWYTALLYPHRLHSAFGMSVPYSPIGPSMVNPPGLEDIFWYIRYFQNPGVAEAELEADIDRSFAFFNGDRAHMPAGLKPRDATLWPAADVESPPLMAAIPPSAQDYYIKLFKKTGFRPSLNWYRNMANIPTQAPWLDGAKILPPSKFLAGENDPVLGFVPGAFDNMEDSFADLHGKVLIPDTDHWVVEQQPALVAREIISFVSAV